MALRLLAVVLAVSIPLAHVAKAYADDDSSQA